MKRIFQILFLSVAVLGLSNCTTYVEDRGYVTSRPAGVYRTPVAYGTTYYGSSYNRGRPVSYRHSSRYGSSRHDRYGRRDRDYDHDHRHNVRHSRRAVDARVSTNVGLFR
jgi:hypothetical protein